MGRSLCQSGYSRRGMDQERRIAMTHSPKRKPWLRRIGGITRSADSVERYTIFPGEKGIAEFVKGLRLIGLENPSNPHYQTL